MKELSKLKKLGLVSLVTIASSCYTMPRKVGVSSSSSAVPMAVDIAGSLISHLAAEQRARKLEERLESIEETTKNQNEQPFAIPAEINPLIQMHYDSNGEHLVFSAGTKLIGNNFDPGTREIYLMRIDGVGGLRQLTDNTHEGIFDGYPRFVGKNKDKIMWIKNKSSAYPELPVAWEDLKGGIVPCNRVDELKVDEDLSNISNACSENFGDFDIWLGAFASGVRGAEEAKDCLRTTGGRAWVNYHIDQITNILGLKVDNNTIAHGIGNTCTLINLGNAFRWVMWKMSQNYSTLSKDTKLMCYDISKDQLSFLLELPEAEIIIDDIKRDGSKAYENLIGTREVASRD